MPPPYTADKRIRDLNALVTPLLNMVLPIDATGFLEANKITLQQIVDIVSPSVTKQIAYAGNVAPDNALGINGDFAFRVPADGSALQMYQKVSGSWVSVFNLPLSYKSEFLSVSLDDTTYPGSIVLPVSLTERQTFAGFIRVNYYTDGTYTTIDRFEILTPTYDADLGLLSGFSEKTDYMKIFVPII